jgi:Ca2+-binding EF-hand superfamily protein
MQRTEKGFIAVSDISDVYELGESASQAIINYLFSLVDELIWFQKRKESLSRSLFKDSTKLRFYVGLV